jgi:SAM-dependent methyltransferase
MNYKQFAETRAAASEGTEDVDFWLDRVRTNPENLASKLFWADAVRNAYVAHVIAQKFKNVRRPIRILDVPSGKSPIFEFLFAQNMAFSYWSVDADENAVNSAQERIAKTFTGGDNTRLHELIQIRDEWKDVDTPDDMKFDAILCLDGPEHLVVMPDLHALDEIFWQFHKLLKDDGLLIVSTPNAKDDGSLHYPYCHEVEFSHIEMCEAIEGNGFEGISARGYRLAPENLNKVVGLDVYDRWEELPYPLYAIMVAWDEPQHADCVITVNRKK